jgi:hypothetical protein
MSVTNGIHRGYHRGPDKPIRWKCTTVSTCTQAAVAYARSPAPTCPLRGLPMRPARAER